MPVSFVTHEDQKSFSRKYACACTCEHWGWRLMLGAHPTLHLIMASAASEQQGPSITASSGLGLQLSATTLRFSTWVLEVWTQVLMLEQQAWCWLIIFTDLRGHIWLLKTFRPTLIFWHTQHKKITLEIGKSIFLKTSHGKRKRKPKTYKCEAGIWIENWQNKQKQPNKAWDISDDSINIYV